MIIISNEPKIICINACSKIDSDILYIVTGPTIKDVYNELMDVHKTTFTGLCSQNIDPIDAKNKASIITWIYFRDYYKYFFVKYVLELYNENNTNPITYQYLKENDWGIKLEKFNYYP